MADFYGVSLEEYRQGQRWTRANSERVREEGKRLLRKWVSMWMTMRSMISNGDVAAWNALTPLYDESRQLLRAFGGDGHRGAFRPPGDSFKLALEVLESRYRGVAPGQILRAIGDGQLPTVRQVLGV